MPVVPPFYLRGLRCLCVSDVNKTLLVQCPDLVTLITDMLLVDPHHPRQSQDEAIKAAIQKDAAECFLQLALFEPGRQMLTKDVAAMEKLHTVADGGGQTLTKDARECAYGAVIAVEGRAREPEPQPDQKHVMLSCECLLASLRPRVSADCLPTLCVACGACFAQINGMYR